MGRRKGEKIMKIPAEFEDILRGVELTEREKRFLRWITSWDDHTMQNMRTVVEKVRSTLSTLQAENETLRAELKSKVDLVFQQAKELDRRHLLLEEQEAELEQVKRERDAALCRLDVVYET
jgi:cell shape-determining protein MreC